VPLAPAHPSPSERPRIGAAVAEDVLAITEAKPAIFPFGSKAKDKNDYIVYDDKKGARSYDADGSGKSKAVEIATLSKSLTM
jgi:hypothetical protein